MVASSGEGGGLRLVPVEMEVPTGLPACEKIRVSSSPMDVDQIHSQVSHGRKHRDLHTVGAKCLLSEL